MTDKVMKAKVRELLKDCHPTYTEKDGTVSVCPLDENLVIDKLTTALSQAQAEARREMLLKDWNDIPKKQQKEFINDMEILTPWGIYCYFKIALEYQFSYLNKLSKEKKI